MFFDIPVGLQKPAVAPTLRVKWSGEKRRVGNLTRATYAIAYDAYGEIANFKSKAEYEVALRG